MSEALGTSWRGFEPRESPGERLAREVGILAARFAEFLLRAMPGEEGPLANACAFLRAKFDAVAEGRPITAFAGSALDRRAGGEPHPLDRLAAGLGLSPCEVDLLLLAGMPEEHEGFADVLRTLHPRGESRPTVGLAAQLFGLDEDGRRSLRRLLETGPATTSGALVVSGEEPFFGRNVLPAESLWCVLQGIDAWPQGVTPLREPVASHGLQAWLEDPAAMRARETLVAGGAATILVTAEEEEVAFQRAAALVEGAGLESVRLRLPAAVPVPVEKLIAVHALARGLVPILRLQRADGPGFPEVPTFAGHPRPAVVCARAGTLALGGSRPLVAVSCERLSPSALQRMWRQTLPQLCDHAPLLAARYPLEPAAALQVAADLGHLEQVGGRKPNLGDVAACVRARAGSALGGGVKLLRPTASWDHLVLSREKTAQLREAVGRLLHQATVLDQWRFLEGRHGARGVRMLFSGPPGTGKTLSAEVLAHTLEVDLLVVDLSRVVSKWIGETEKNLAEVFETAERARAVLLFDEADALFGKRTEVSDAHDRYANLETAYLLARLERFEGLAMLATNLRQNIDPAFTRRLEFVVEFGEPDREERLALWRCHLPATAPLAGDVNLEELAALYPMVGGMIRNAAVAAAFLAAADGTTITRTHFIRAIRREYDKAAKAFPGLPAGMSQT